MTDLWNDLASIITVDKALSLIKAGVLLLLGFLLAALVARLIRRLTASRLEVQQAILLRRAGYYLVLVLFIVAALHQLGFNLGVLLGAAGVLSVAVGFASQTSASNLVSGLFLIGERPFAVGDTIQVDNTTGVVLSIDLLSVKLRTFDNLFVRIPNETVLKTEVRTLTRFPIRRYDMQVGVAYKEDLDVVRTVLLEVADRHPMCLDEPKPMVLLLGFGDSAVNLQLSVWGRQEGWIDFRNQMLEGVKRALDDAGIEIPFPHRSLYVGSETEPLPVRMVPAAQEGRSRDETSER